MANKKQQMENKSVTVSAKDLQDIKSALWRIEWAQEMAFCSPTSSDGYMFIMADMAAFIGKKLGIERQM